MNQNFNLEFIVYIFELVDMLIITFIDMFRCLKWCIISMKHNLESFRDMMKDKKTCRWAVTFQDESLRWDQMLSVLYIPKLIFRAVLKQKLCCPEKLIFDEFQEFIAW